MINFIDPSGRLDCWIEWEGQYQLPVSIQWSLSEKRAFCFLKWAEGVSFAICMIRDAIHYAPSFSTRSLAMYVIHPIRCLLRCLSPNFKPAKKITKTVDCKQLLQATCGNDERWFLVFIDAHWYLNLFGIQHFQGDLVCLKDIAW